MICNIIFYVSSSEYCNNPLHIVPFSLKIILLMYMPLDFKSLLVLLLPTLFLQGNHSLSCCYATCISSSNRYEWGAELQRVLSRDHEYSLLTAEQLVGVCLYIFVRPHLIPFIRYENRDHTD